MLCLKDYNLTQRQSSKNIFNISRLWRTKKYLPVTLLIATRNYGATSAVVIFGKRISNNSDSKTRNQDKPIKRIANELRHFLKGLNQRTDRGGKKAVRFDGGDLSPDLATRETAVESTTSCKMQERECEKKKEIPGERETGEIRGWESRRTRRKIEKSSEKSIWLFIAFSTAHFRREIYNSKREKEGASRFAPVGVFRPRSLSGVKTEIFLDRFFLNSGVSFFFFFLFRFLAHSRPERIPSTYSKMASFHLRSARRIPVPHYAGPDSLSARRLEFFRRRKQNFGTTNDNLRILSVLIFDKVIGQKNSIYEILFEIELYNLRLNIRYRKIAVAVQKSI